MHKLLAVVIAGGTALAAAGFAQTLQEIGALPDPKTTPPVIAPGKTDHDPPSDAVVLFDGKDLSRWHSREGGEAKWLVKDGYAEVVAKAGPIVTRDEFGDCQLHIEWASPAEVKGEGQGRGNSGVFLMDRYEVQVLDSFENKTYAHGQAAAIYKQYPPLVNASRKPGEWQSYDIVFHAPRFNEDGRVIDRARMTVFHNGVLVQNGVELLGDTPHMRPAVYIAHGPKGPLSLQDHGNPVRYRNIWIRPL
jgi:3-keto-disaccharide hydrolase